MALFLSTYINKIDIKGRVSLPAAFRNTLASEPFQGFVSFRSYKHPALECYTYSRMDQLSASVDSLDLFSQEQDDLTAAIFADALQIPFDSDGRIVLPKKLCDFANISDRVAFVGRGATFQIWAPESFEQHQDLARQRIHAHQTPIKIGAPPPERGSTL